MITVYRYKGKFGDDALPADYIPCLIGIDEHGDEAYFETVGEIDPQHIQDSCASKWISHPVIMIRYGTRTIYQRQARRWCAATSWLTNS
jgi:hypothetical protein